MRAYEAVAQAVEEEGVRSIFCLMGVGNMPILVNIRERGRIQVFDARHEGAALAMADGFARASGDVGVCSVTNGPGLTQLGTSLMVASRHRSPIVVIAGDTPTGLKGMGNMQDMDQRSFAEASGALFHQLRGPGSVAQDVQQAFWLARTRRLPVVLNCPVDIQNGDLVGEFTYQRSSARIGKTPPMMPDPAEVEKAADMIANARRPVLVAGLGAVTSGAREALDALGDRIGAALATTIRAKGYLDGPWSIGICGNLGSSKVEPFLERADLVIFVGSSVSTNVTGGGSLFPKARTLQIDSDATSIVGGRPADHLLVGDARLAVEAIVQRLAEAEFTAPGYRDSTYNELFEVDPLAREVEHCRGSVAENEIDPHRLLQELDKFLPRECTLVIGSGHFFAFPCTYLNGYRSRRFLYTYDFGTIGQAIPTGFGVAVADPSRPVVVIEGDASTLMNVHMFDSTAHYEPKMLILVMNDGALGAEFHQLSAKGQDPEWALMPTPDFGRLAAVFGNAGSTLVDATKAEHMISSFVSGTGTHVVDVRISRNVISRHFRKAYFSGSDQPHVAQKVP